MLALSTVYPPIYSHFRPILSHFIPLKPRFKANVCPPKCPINRYISFLILPKFVSLNVSLNVPLTRFRPLKDRSSMRWLSAVLTYFKGLHKGQTSRPPEGEISLSDGLGTHFKGKCKSIVRKCLRSDLNSVQTQSKMSHFCKANVTFRFLISQARNPI